MHEVPRHLLKRVQDLLTRVPPGGRDARYWACRKEVEEILWKCECCEEKPATRMMPGSWPDFVPYRSCAECNPPITESQFRAEMGWTD